MNRAERLVFLAVLTSTLYALFMWIEKGAFIFPFPLNEIIFFIVGTTYLCYNYNESLLLSLLIGGFAMCSLLCSEVFLQFFLDGASWEKFHSNVLPYLVTLQIIVLISWFIYSLYQSILLGKRFLWLIPSTSFILAFFITSPQLLIVSFAGIGYSLSKLKLTNQSYLLWYLLAFLIGAKSFTLLQLG
jgi:hypothetical protein